MAVFSDNMFVVFHYKHRIRHSFPMASGSRYSAYADTMRGTSGDAFLVAFTSSHKRIWTTYFGGTQYPDPLSQYGLDIAYGITAFQGSKLFLVGATASDTTFPLANGGGSPVYFNNNNAGLSGFISRFDLGVMPLGINELNDFYQNIFIFPNPTSGISTLQVNVSQSSDIKVSVFDIIGKQLYYQKYSKITGTRQIPLDFSYFSKGIYVVKVTSQSKECSVKVVVE